MFGSDYNCAISACSTRLYGSSAAITVDNDELNIVSRVARH